MKLTFQLYNNHFDDAFLISLNGQKQTMNKENRSVVFEVEDAPEYLVRVDYIRTNHIDADQIRNPILKFLAYLFACLISPIIFFADHYDNGIGIHKFFCEAKPFDLTKTFRIAATEAPMWIDYHKPEYQKDQCILLQPDILIKKTTVFEETKSCRYNRGSFQKEFALYHFPAYMFLLIVVLLLTALMFWCLVGQFSPPDLFGIIGMSFCCIVMLGLLIAFICLFVFTCKIFKRIDRALKEKN